MDREKVCCTDIFADFKFANIKNANPPDAKGVYVIIIKKRSLTSHEIIDRMSEKLSSFDWPIARNYIIDRLDRLKRITEGCPVIYIGSAGTKEGSKHTLIKRYGDFKNRHTAQYPIWALLYFGWELEYGWKETQHPAELE
ncbi:MAG: hypothetical protein Q8T08_08645, partial [Ignavibacteria bacterium]|nr:hypothetical protein [Ignavibacteria bacterium]